MAGTALDPPGDPARQRQRLAAVYRRWQRQYDLPSNRPRTGEAGWVGDCLGVFLAILLIPFSQAILPISTLGKMTISPAITLWPLQPAQWLKLLPLYLLNAWLLEGLLAQRTPRSYRWRPAVVWARRLLCGLPLLGFWCLPLWTWILERQPTWAQRAATGLPRLEALPRRSLDRRVAVLAAWSRRLRRHATSTTGLGWLLLGYGLAVGLVVWSTTSTSPLPSQRLAVAAVGGGLHLQLPSAWPCTCGRMPGGSDSPAWAVRLISCPRCSG